jgi:hypothetical protein
MIVFYMTREMSYAVDAICRQPTRGPTPDSR